MEEKLISVQEMTKATGLHFNTIYRMIKSGELEATKQGKSYMIKASEIEKCKIIMTNELLKNSRNKLEIYKELEESAITLLCTSIEEVFKDAKDILSYKKKNTRNIDFEEFFNELELLKYSIDDIDKAMTHYGLMCTGVKVQKELCEELERLL